MRGFKTPMAMVISDTTLKLVKRALSFVSIVISAIIMIIGYLLKGNGDDG